MTRERATESQASAPISAGHSAPEPRGASIPDGYSSSVHRAAWDARLMAGVPRGFPRQGREPFHVERSPLTPCSLHDGSRPARRDTDRRARRIGNRSTRKRGWFFVSSPGRWLLAAASHLGRGDDV